MSLIVDDFKPRLKPVDTGNYAPSVKKNYLKRFKDPHHKAARLIASGVRPLERVAAMCGYAVSRIYTLNVDPAFQELVARYRPEVLDGFKEGVDDYYEVATSNMLKAERMLAEKLDGADEEGELLPTRDLIAISRDAADRFGYGKKQTNLNVNVDFAAQLEKAIKRSGKEPRTIDAKAVSVQPSPQHSPPVEDHRPSSRTAQDGPPHPLIREPIRRRA